MQSDRVQGKTDDDSDFEPKHAKEIRKAMYERDSMIQESREIIEIEDNVLPIVEEFSVDDILGDLSSDVDEQLKQIGNLLDEHRVEVKNEVGNKAVLTSASGETT